MEFVRRKGVDSKNQQEFLGGCRETRSGNRSKNAARPASRGREQTRLVIVDGKVTAFRARVNLSFKYEGKD
jgi:hypothetical protein